MIRSLCEVEVGISGELGSGVVGEMNGGGIGEAGGRMDIPPKIKSFVPSVQVCRRSVGQKRH